MTAIIIGCKSEKNPAPGGSCEEPFDITINNTMPANCDAEDGSFEWSTTPGKQIVSMSVGGQSVAVSSTVTSLSAGIYELVLVAEDGCESTANVTIPSESGLTASLDQTTPSDCDVDNGSVSLSASGGTEPYTYDVGGSTNQTGSFNSLTFGDYTATITDNNGCSATVSFNIDASISFNSDVEPLIQNNCAVPGCHVAGTGRVVFANYNDIQANASNIRQRVSTGIMPPQNSGYDLTQQQRDDIVCWIDAGAKNN
ncbi:hypothetical protein OO013_15540 [Mangrovivirga sp. M17]|uniref:SprB repeat-containing protein n=1 Tax=Mangrovivirga halotolerans TaxID=2993936 RepID=A0ABT3RUF7_9BACT|nr:hypothetical protein [Mangrovivirga halotolerans]MCX2745291.1 hypothetical protein [Mangrovivirga halotolerans]